MKLKTIYGNVIFALNSAKTILELVIAARLAGRSLYDVNLRMADLRGADLRGANLRGADLYGADLRGVNLRWAELYGADLYMADLRGADLYGAKNAEMAIARLQFIPTEGQFIGWKKCVDGVIVKLRIPANAKRSHGSERKCRCSEAVVMAIYGPDGVELKSAKSMRDSEFTYTVGKTVKPDGFDENRWNTCGQGIHFYLTREEAVAHF